MCLGTDALPVLHICTSEQIDIAFDSSNFKSNFSFIKNSNHFEIRFLNSNGNNYNTVIDSSVDGNGILKMIRYDLNNGIFSGTFEFILRKPGYETIIVTEETFDKKL